jgi:UDP-galactopyranose mutase
MKYDYLIIGAGLFGSVFAQQATANGKSVLVIEKRDHIGGNCYTKDIEGINVHYYGAHIFHTSNLDIWNYVNRFVKFNNYKHQVIANYKGDYYSLPFNMWTFNKMWNVTTPEGALSKIKEQTFSGLAQNLEEKAISLVGKDLYEKLIKGYTKKQWKKDPKQLPAFIIERLPVRFTYDNNYYFDSYQGIPENGYTELFIKLLDRTEVKLEIDYFSNRKYWNSVAKKIIYTGPLDQFYNYKFGTLDYISLKFDHRIIKKENFQGNSVINFTDEQVPYTRIIEHKHFYNTNSKSTAITYEYPIEYNKNEIPYYPINDDHNKEIFKKYKSIADQEGNIIFGGRLAEYRYYDMHQVIASAIHKFNNENKICN